MRALHSSRRALGSFALHLGATYLLCGSVHTPMKAAAFPFPPRKHISQTRHNSSSCKLPTHLWKTKAHLSFLNHRTNREGMLLPVVAAAVCVEDKHMLYSIVLILQTAANSPHHTACPTGRPDVKCDCGVASTQQLANEMLGSVSWWAGVFEIMFLCIFGSPTF